MQMRLLGLAAAPVLVLALSSCGSSSGNTAADTSTPSSPASAPSTTASTASTASASASSGAAGGATCAYPQSPQAAAKPVQPPPTTPAYTAKTPAVISTTAGDIHVMLNGDTTPCTVNSFASLAKQGYYDSTPCPRITTDPGFQVLQCGDPTGTGSGGPGYQFADELTGKEAYAAGTLAMANAGPGTNGSQFFIVYGDTQLSPAYTVFGTVPLADLAGIKAIGAKGSDNSNPAGGGKPATPISIKTVTIG